MLMSAGSESVIGEIPGYAVSPQQRRLWLLQHQADCFTAEVHVAVGGPLDPARLQRAVDRVAARHDSLRTTFHVPPGMKAPVQRVGETTHLHATLDRQSGDAATLVLTMPAICGDAWTLRNLVRDIADLYAEAPEREEPIQYVQFAEWQRELLASPQAAVGRAFWRDQPAAGPAAVRLACEGRGTNGTTFAPRWLQAELDADTIVQADTLAQRGGATRAAVFFSAWQTLLWRLARQPIVESHVEVDGREYAELHDACGPFARALPVRSEMAAQTTFHDLLAASRDRLRDYYEWQIYFTAPDPAPTPDPSLFPYLFTCHEPGDDQTRAGVRFAMTRQQVCYEPFKLQLAITGRRMTLGYDASRFDAADMQVLAEQYRTLLASAVSAPQQTLGVLAINSVDHQARMRATRVTSPACPAADPIDTFERRAAAAPDDVAIVCGPTRMTYGTFNARANQLAAHLRAQGVGLDTRVALCFERSPEMFVAILAVLKAGGAYVPLDPTYPAERLRWMLEETAAPIVLTHAAVAAQAPSVRGAVVVDLDRAAELLAVQDPSNRPRRARPDDAAYVIYTSGSTGRPKGVVITRDNIARLFRETDGWYRFRPDDVWSMCHNYAFDVSVWEMWGAWLHGGRLVVASRLDTRAPAQLLALLARERVTIFSQTPSAFRQLAPELAREEAPPLGVRALVFAGEPLDTGMVRGWLARYPESAVVNMYGITETTVHSTYKRIETADVQQPERSPIGVAFADSRTYLLHDDGAGTGGAGAGGAEAGFWETGELYLAGAGLARGYLQRPELTAERFLPEIDPPTAGARMYRSGDLARRRPDGTLEYVGRRDHQVKIRGYRVEPGEIEMALRQQPGVREAAVLIKGEGGDRRLVAYVFRAAGQTLEVETLRGALQGLLPDYMVPAVYVVLDDLPLTPNGKLDTRALPEPDHQRPALQQTFVAPGTEAERVLADIWADVLGIEQVGVQDNFFDIGGHSLLMIKVHGRMRDTLGLDVSILDLFARPTVKLLAELMTGAPRATPELAAPADSARTDARRAAARRQRSARAAGRGERGEDGS
jgi:amino acid adenylation domain-containing protein